MTHMNRRTSRVDWPYTEQELKHLSTRSIEQRISEVTSPEAFDQLMAELSLRLEARAL